MCSIHNYVQGIDEQLTCNTFYKYAACLQGKPAKSPRGPQTSLKHKGKKYKTNKHKEKSTPPTNANDHIDDIFIPNSNPGQHFHMDFGFVGAHLTR